MPSEGFVYILARWPLSAQGDQPPRMSRICLLNVCTLNLMVEMQSVIVAALSVLSSLGPGTASSQYGLGAHGL